MVIRFRTARLLLFLASPYWLIKVIYDFFIVVPEEYFNRVVLLSPVKGNLLLTFILLPFLCMAVSVFLHYFPARHKHSRSQQNMLTLSVLIMVIALSTVALNIPRFSEKNPQPVSVHDIIDLDNLSRRIVFSSNSYLGKIRMKAEERFFSFDSLSRTYEIKVEEIPELIRIKMTEETFLDRKNIRLKLESRGTPHRVRLLLHSTNEFTLFDSNFPFQRQKGGLEYSVLIGANPPSPLDIDLTLPQGTSCTLDFTIDYTNIPYPFETDGEHKTFDELLTFHQTFRIDT